MVAGVKHRIKPKNGLAHLVHLGLMALLPLLVFIMVRINFAPLALALILLSKWRMFAVKPRHWLAHLRANAVDIIVGVSLLIFMAQSSSQMIQLGWAGCYAVWLLLIKPSSQVWAVSLQALLGQIAGLTALFLRYGDAPVASLMLAAWAICYVAARHYLTSFDESFTRLFANLWGYFAACFVWLLSHWLLFYGPIAQPTLFLSVLAFALMTLYYLDETDRLSAFYRRQIVFIMMAVVIIIIVSSGWRDTSL